MDENFILLQKKIDDHIDDYKKDRIRDDERWIKLAIAQEQNANTVSELVDSTKALVKAQQTASSIVQFVRWLSGLAVIGWMIQWISEHIK